MNSIFPFSTLLRSAAIAATLSVAGAGLAHADAVEAPAFAKDRAFDVAMARIIQDLSHEQVAVMNLIAHGAAAAGLCDGLELDEAAVHGALVEATHDATIDASAEDMQNHRDFAMIAFGVLTAFAMDRAVADEAAYCADAQQLSDDALGDMFVRRVPASAEEGAETQQ